MARFEIGKKYKMNWNDGTYEYVTYEGVPRNKGIDVFETRRGWSYQARVETDADGNEYAIVGRNGSNGWESYRLDA